MNLINTEKISARASIDSIFADSPRFEPSQPHPLGRQSQVLRISGATVFAFATGFFTPFTVSLVGAMPVGELVLAIVLVLVVIDAALGHRLAGGRLLSSPLLWTFLGCQLAAFASYVMADLYRGSSTLDIERGWARMFFLAIDLITIAYLFGQTARKSSGSVFTVFQWGYVLGMTWQAAFGEVLFGDYWKFGYAIPVTIAVLLLAPRLGFWAAQIASLGLGVLHMALDFRSMGAVCLLLPAGLMLQRLRPKTRILMLPVCVAVALGAILYSYGKTQNANSETHRNRSDIERIAMLQAAWNGFCRSPLIGNGSWFSKSPVMDDFFAIRYQLSVLNGGGSFSAQDDTNGGITLHSQILVGLAEGGVFGACFFIAYGVGLLWGIFHLTLVQQWHRLSPLYLFTLIMALWSLAMSPFSGMHRVLIAVAAGLVLILWRDRMEERVEAEPQIWRGHEAIGPPPPIRT